MNHIAAKIKIFKERPAGTTGDTVTVIEPKAGWQIIDTGELREYRDLFFFLVWRDIKVLYAQTIMGFSWAILQPLIQLVIFTIVFGKVANVSTDGIPYVLFSSVAIIPWTYMSQAMTNSSQSLISGKEILGKVYFPRLIFPITSVLAKLVDFGISLLIILFVIIYYRVMPTWNMLLFPVLVMMMMGVSAGVGMWLSAMAIRFRDVKHAMPFAIRMLMYSAPIVYSASSIPEKYRLLYSLNPIVGVIEGFRACLLGTPVQWGYIWPGLMTAILLVCSGALYFKRMERVFADVI
ncbi:phosphate ABC transporter permease [Desulfonema ishimotonii]|uniref:Transport permease protein n=1 Tax=Desulfonema ishimotonii TaxID=45657 RepID=A0A401FVG5_9BACT|nr:ABC transporter permease [Desulfonema ishimotonii]GBC60943.1 phosphate ABC transporter permease [Desulfonema ishimotonii]